MRLGGDEPTDCGELLEVLPFVGHERVFLEVRHDPGDQVVDAADFVLDGAVAPVWPDRPAPEVLAHEQEHLVAVRVLTHREAGPHLPSRTQLAASRERDGETALPVHVARDVRRDVHRVPPAYWLPHGFYRSVRDGRSGNPRPLWPQSIQGQSQQCRDDFPRYHPRATARRRSGFTDISRYGLVFTYPTRNFATLGPL